MEVASITTKYKPGMRVQLLLKEYATWTPYTGVIASISTIKKMPTIVVAFCKDEQIKLAYYNKETAAQCAIVSDLVGADLPDKDLIVAQYDNAIQGHTLEAEKLKQKRDEFIKMYERYFKDEDK